MPGNAPDLNQAGTGAGGAGPRRTFDVAIVGGGPAALAAGIYCCRAGVGAILIEMAMTGGTAATTDRVENYPGFPEPISGMELAQLMERQARRFGLRVEQGLVSAVRATGSAGGFTLALSYPVGGLGAELQASSVVVATGTSRATLGVPGEEKLTGRGVSYCATCDGPLYRGKRVVVVGGGDSAIEEALFLSRFAEAVTVVHRRDSLRAARVLEQEARANPRIRFEWNSVVASIQGDMTVESVSLRDVQTGERKPLQADGVFIYVGNRPNSALVRDMVDCDEAGFILTDERMRTSIPGVFAAGDVRAKPLRQIVTAVADGAVAGVEAAKHAGSVHR